MKFSWKKLMDIYKADKEKGAYKVIGTHNEVGDGTLYVGSLGECERVKDYLEKTGGKDITITLNGESVSSTFSYRMLENYKDNARFVILGTHPVIGEGKLYSCDELEEATKMFNYLQKTGGTDLVIETASQNSLPYKITCSHSLRIQLPQEEVLTREAPIVMTNCKVIARFIKEAMENTGCMGEISEYESLTRR